MPDQDLNQTSQSLLERAQTGADDAWQRIAELYQPLVHRWVGQCGVRNDDLDDLAQDVVTVLLRELPRFEHNGRVGAFRAWLRTICVNQVRLNWRKGRLRPTATGDSEFQKRLSDLEDPRSEISTRWDQEHDEHVILKLLELAGKRFTSQTIRLFRRHVLDGVSAAEVGEECGVTVAGVYTAKSRVLSFLRVESAGLLDDSELIRDAG